jgi:nitrilase
MNKRLPTVRAAAVQAEPVVLDLEATVDKACRLIAEAAGQGAQLIVFPELFIPVYTNSGTWGRGLVRFGAPDAQAAWLRLWHNSIIVPGPVIDRLGQAAREARALVAMGVSERDPHNKSLYNTLIFIGPQGELIGKHRKLTPTNHERMVHGVGDGRSLRVYDTPVGRIGGLICWENWSPLARYALYSHGEQIHVAPTPFDDPEMALANARNTAFEGKVFVIQVCMPLRKASYPADFELPKELAEDNEYQLSGGSVIVAPDGCVLAGPLWKEEGILYADLDLNQTVANAQLLDVAGHYGRQDVFKF